MSARLVFAGRIRLRICSSSREMNSAMLFRVPSSAAAYRGSESMRLRMASRSKTVYRYASPGAPFARETRREWSEGTMRPAARSAQYPEAAAMSRNAAIEEQLPHGWESFARKDEDWNDFWLGLTCPPQGSLLIQTVQFRETFFDPGSRPGHESLCPSRTPPGR